MNHLPLLYFSAKHLTCTNIGLSPATIRAASDRETNLPTIFITVMNAERTNEGVPRTHWNILLGKSSTHPFSEVRKLEKKTPESHEDYRNGRESLECKSCKIKFYGRSRVSNLNKHIGAAHLNKRPFRCNKCQKEFQFQYRLQKHVDTVHLGIRPFSCNRCDQRFSDKSNRKKHVQGRSCRRGTKAAIEENAIVSDVQMPP